MERDALRALVAGIGPLDDRIVEIVELEDAGAGWVVRLAAIDLRIEHLPQFGQIGVSATIDGPSDAQEPAAMRALMASNVLWRENGGLRFALGSSDNLIEVSAVLPEAGLTVRALVATCMGVAEHAATWTLVFAGRVAPDAAAAGPLPPDFDPSFLRL